ncbi:MAG TPA: HdeD family acid-resistance protein [Methyloceanibacter sp.]|nr:HdeD family acid-resistance protein [Methyloceanibacter sp.]
MGMTLDEAAAVMREAMRETVRKYSVWYLLQGGLMVVAGVLALLYPFFASTAIVVLLGWLLIFAGVVQGIGLIGAGNVPHYWLQLISAALAIVIGLLLLRQPDSGLLIITVLLLLYFLVEGLSKVIFALTIRPFPHWGWVLLSGIVGILLAVYLWANLPVDSAWVLGVLLGILLIAEGAALTYLAWRVRSATAEV